MGAGVGGGTGVGVGVGIGVDVGRGVGDGGIRGRLLNHLRNDYWPDVTHFGYCVCSTAKEAEDFEASEIKRLQPKYNTQGK